MGGHDEEIDTSQHPDGAMHRLVPDHHLHRIYPVGRLSLRDSSYLGRLRSRAVPLSQSLPNHGLSSRGASKARFLFDELRCHLGGCRWSLGLRALADGRDWWQSRMEVCFSLSHSKGYCGLQCFRWVYIIEGLFSFICAILIWFGLPNNPAEAYFLTEEEKWMMRVRNEQRRRYMGSEEFSWEEMRIAIRDPKLMFSALIQFCQDILLYGFSTFLPTILRGMGYDSLMSNVLTVPVYVWAAMIFIAIAWCSDRYSQFALVRLAPCNL